MGRHVEAAFGRELKEYTLFHNPSVGFGDLWDSVRYKFGITTPVTRKFASLLSSTQAAGNETQWVAHSEGGIVFAEAGGFLLTVGRVFHFNKLRFSGVLHP